MIAVILIRGLIDTKQAVRSTLKRLRLSRKNHLVLVKDDPKFKGMIKRVRDYITWGKISDEALNALITKRGRLSGDKRVNPKEVPKMVKDLNAGKWPAGLKRVFRLSPPKKGFERLGIKYPYPRGALGPRGDKINELILKMV